MLSVRNGAKAIEFYKAAFGAAELFRVGDENGVVAQLSVGGAEFWVADESPENLNFSPESLGGGTVRLVMVVDDPDAAFARAVKAGRRWSGRSRISLTAGALDGSLIRLGIIGRLAGRWVKVPKVHFCRRPQWRRGKR